MLEGRSRAASAALLVLSLSTVGVSAPLDAKELKPTSFQASYEMEADADEMTPVPACAAASSVAFEDTRTDELIGRRFHEKTPSVKLPITMTGDASEWLRSGFTELARRAVLSTQSPGRPSITLELASLWVDETVYRNAEYDARIVIDVTVRSPDGASTCWSERVDGFAENYGRAGKEVNYQETVNHALDKATLKILHSAELTEALCSCAGTEK